LHLPVGGQRVRTRAGFLEEQCQREPAAQGGRCTGAAREPTEGRDQLLRLGGGAEALSVGLRRQAAVRLQEAIALVRGERLLVLPHLRRHAQ